MNYTLTWRPRRKLTWLGNAVLLYVAYVALAFVCHHWTAFTQAVPIWLPAGVALAGCLRLGVGFIPFAALGNASFNIAYFGQHTTEPLQQQILVGLAIGFGGGLQGWVGSVLLKRYLGPELKILDARSALVYALCAGLLTCLISATSGASIIQWVYGLQGFGTWFNTFITWYLGDCFGAIVFTPLVLELFALRHAAGQELPRRLLLVGGLLAVVSIFVYFHALLKKERFQAIGLAVDRRVAEVQEQFGETAELVNSALTAVKAYVQVESRPAAENFRLFVLPLLEQTAPLQAISWNPIVAEDELPEFRDWLIAQHGREVPINWEPLYPGDPYVVVSMIEPREGNDQSLGLNVYGEPKRRLALRRADRTQHTVATELIQLVQDDHSEPGFLLFLPVYQRDPVPGGAWHDRLLGYVTGVMQVPQLLDFVLSRTESETARYRLFQVGAEAPVWGNYPDWRHTPLPAANLRALDIEVFGIWWRLQVSIGMEAMVREFAVTMRGTQGVQVILAVMLGIFMLLLRSQRDFLENAVAIRTRELKETQHRFERILDQAPQLISVVDRQGRLNVSNRAYDRLLKGTLHETAGGADDPVADEFWRAIEQGVRDHGQMLQRGIQLRLDNEFRTYQVQGFPLGLDAHGDVDEVCCIATDLSDYLKAVNEMHSAQAESQAKGEFLAMMSHEIRTPLNGVLGAAQLLDSTQLDENQHNLLDTIDRSGRALMNVIGNILDYSKISAGKVHLETKAFVLDELFRDCADITRSGNERTEVSLLVQSDPEVPRYLLADAHRLRQVLLNLLSNALKFTHRGAVTLASKLLERSDEHHCRVRISVRDSGIGMTREQIDRLFHSFTQADQSITREYGGTGLGLVISKELVELMGGNLYLESEPGVGSVFHLDLPLECSDTGQQDKADHAQKAQMDGVAPGAALDQLSVLIAEDNDVNAMVLERLLRNEGAVVERVVDGKQALERYLEQEGRYALVLLDCEMPVMDGFDASRQLRALEQQRGWPSVPILAQTAHVVPEYLQRCLQCGMNAYVTKPLDRAQLIAKIQEVLANT